MTLAAFLGWCAAAWAATKPAITAPPDGAVVSSPFIVEADYGAIEYCDTGGCTDVPAESVSLYADPNFMLLGTCATKTECPNGKASFEASLAVGEYELQVIADDGGFSSVSSERVTITVEAAATTGATETSGGSGGSTMATGATAASGPSDAPKDDGCGCDATDAPTGALTWFAAAALLFRRRWRSEGRASRGSA